MTKLTKDHFLHIEDELIIDVGWDKQKAEQLRDEIIEALELKRLVEETESLFTYKIKNTTDKDIKMLLNQDRTLLQHILSKAREVNK